MEVRCIPMEQLAPLLEEQLRGGFAHLPVTGSSMLPMLRHGRDVVRLVPLEGAPASGDVMLYRRGDGQYVLHRIIRMEDSETCLCCGDNQWEREFVPQARMIARVDRFCRAGRWYDVEDAGYQLYAKLWTGLFPVRRPILWARRVLGQLRRAIIKNGGKPR